MKTLEQIKKILGNAVVALFRQPSKNSRNQQRIYRDISGCYSYFVSNNGVIIRID